MAQVPDGFLEGNVERYRKLIRGERVEYAPFRLWLDCTFVCEYANVNPKDYSSDIEVMFEAQKIVNDRFYGLRDFSIDIGNADIFFDLEKFNEDHPESVPDRVLEKDLDNFDRYFCTTPIAETKAAKEITKAIEYFNSRLPDDKKVYHYLGSTGAMDLYSIFRGTEKFFIDLYDHPAKVKKIFDFLFQRTLEWIEFTESRWGNMPANNNLYDKVDIGEDYCAYLPPELFDEFVRPYTGEIFNRYKGKALCSLHTDGDIIPSGISQLNKLNIDELMGFSPNIDIKDFREALPDVILAGNIHPINVMIEGTPEDVKNAARYCFETANQNQKFVLCTGGAISAGAKPENVDAFIESTYEIVKYDNQCEDSYDSQRISNTNVRV
ncbi:uroporphyrinogen decarboxylase family protein [Sedimentisphaera salicampi]|uniref:Methylcobalamin:coenzyme M methyltransferase n=1 Tax=Sedimentisphaera salicampi TaxID=1941349 RepID=A0A1W6LJ18_9BACT|nr:uroporphyrinogen decarboxylase family protein [Sedimentisphaera salicampi]ARN55790.1 methylcobalamin:coenzyme M methyltransferase [Sedimentisphaera salicampi]OXU15983.1 methylcobalamin:coenzyme M methyltransferase [Sedimentisphaera salicampi]